jgi:hypothetical protein
VSSVEKKLRRVSPVEKEVRRVSLRKKMEAASSVVVAVRRWPLRVRTRARGAHGLDERTTSGMVQHAHGSMAAWKPQRRGATAVKQCQERVKIRREIVSTNLDSRHHTSGWADLVRVQAESCVSGLG